MTSTAPRKPAAKPAVPAKAAPAKAAVKQPKKPKKPKKEKKAEKPKVVRDSFSMPQADFGLIAELKQKALNAGWHVKKSELLRAGLRLLSGLSVPQLARAVAGLEKVKTGRPGKT